MHMQGYRSRVNPFTKELIQFGLSRGLCVGEHVRAAGNWDEARAQKQLASGSCMMCWFALMSPEDWAMTGAYSPGTVARSKAPARALERIANHLTTPDSTLAFLRCRTGMKYHHSIKLHLKPSSGNARKKIYLYWHAYTDRQVDRQNIQYIRCSSKENQNITEWQCSECMRLFFFFLCLFFCILHEVWHFLVQKILQLAQRERLANTVHAAAADQDRKVCRCARTGVLHLPPCFLLLTFIKIDAFVSMVKQTCPSA